VSDRERLLDLVRAAAASLDANRRRIDDLNVYPVPDGDTGTNLTLTVKAALDALEGSTADARLQLAHELTRATLMGARGNSGVILSQIVRGAADVLGAADTVDSHTVCAAARSASDAAYRAVRQPVEGTMLTVIREIAEAADARRDDPPAELLRALLERADAAVTRTPEQLDVLREAGVVDAGGAGLAEILRGVVAAATGEQPPEAPVVEPEEAGLDAIHQELSRYRYCTTFFVEGDELDPDGLERELERLGDSLLVVGDRSALKVHVHTDDPGAALQLGSRLGVMDGIEIANMHRQTAEREQRLLRAVPDSPPAAADVVAVVAGDGNRALYERLGARVVTGGQSMNPATADIVAAIEAGGAEGAVVLPNNSNVILAAEQAAAAATKPAEVVATRSIPAGLAAMVAFEPSRSVAENAEEMRAAVAGIGTGAVTVASRDVELNGLRIGRGDWLGLLEGEPVAGSADFDAVAREVVDRLLAEPRGLLTLLTGADEPPLERLLERLAQEHPGLELDVQAGGQPHYALLLAAE
jgi:DAK2 domain fusion protein YloV